MKRAALSDAEGPLVKAAADGLTALGWDVSAGNGADLRIEFLESSASLFSVAMDGGCASVVLVAPAGGRFDLSGLSLEVQRLAVAAAPMQRVNGIAVESGHDDALAATIDWLAGAAMVTGQLILLSDAPGPSIPF